jgi:hypothetical protein
VDSSWKKLSHTLDAGSKIYTYRVDAIETAIKLARSGRENARPAQSDDPEDQNVTPDEIRQVNDTTFLGHANLKNFIRNAMDHIEPPENLLLEDLDSNFFDPMLQKISSKFDEGGYKGLLVNSLLYDDKLIYVMHDDHETSKQKEMPPESIEAFQDIMKQQNELIRKTIDGLRQKKICQDLFAFREYFKDVRLSGGPNFRRQHEFQHQPQFLQNANPRNRFGGRRVGHRGL